MMADIRVDLFSDTTSRPTPAMRRAMAEAEVGDEQRFEDPTVNRLQERVADLLGKESAVYLPSGTMCNAISLAVHSAPGDEVICDRSSHPINAEGGGPAAISGVMIRALDGERGIFSAEQVASAIRPDSRYSPRSRVVSVENTTNYGGGACWPLETVREVAKVSHDGGLALHMDGARLLNAVVATGVPAADYAEPFDSVWIDFSKGLGAPVGAVLAGSAELVREAWGWKQRLGGAMRQSGIIAAGCLYALDHHVERLAEDHENARVLAEGLAELPGVRLDPETVETNIVIVELEEIGAPELIDRMLAEHGVRLSLLTSTTARAVTYLDITRGDVETALDAARAVLGG